MKILQEQFEELVLFSFTLSTCISNIEGRIFLDTHTVSGQQPVTKILFHKLNMVTTYDYIKNILRIFEANSPKIFKTIQPRPKIKTFL